MKSSTYRPKPIDVAGQFLTSRVLLVVVVGLVLFTAFAVLCWIIVDRQRAEVSGSPLKSAIATIAERGLVFHGQDRTRSYVILHFDGFKHRYEYWVAYFNPDRLSAARKVSLKYRVGKSGQPYIEYLEPLPDDTRR